MNPDINSMSVYDAAKYYSENGIIVHNVQPRGKAPIVSGWQMVNAPMSEDTLKKRFNGRDVNIGFLTGRYSDLLIIDVDRAFPGIWGEIFKNQDDLIKVQHVKGRYHVIFRHTDKIKPGQYKWLGFDVLSDHEEIGANGVYTKGNNCIAPPSIHADGSKYQITGDITARKDMPEDMVNKINKLIEVHRHITKEVLPKCRTWFRILWKNLYELKDSEIYNDGSIFYGSGEARNRCLAFFAELKANGAQEHELILICATLFGERFSFEQSRNEINHIEAKPAKTETIQADPILSKYDLENKKFPKADRESKKSPEKPEKVMVFFDEVANSLLSEFHMFAMEDTGEIFIYKDGVYNRRGYKTRLSKEIRETYSGLYLERFNELFTGMDKTTEIKIPPCDTKYIGEVIEYIRDYTAVSRDDIDKMQLDYINFKNGTFDIKEWKFIKHDPAKKLITQLPVTYDPTAECPAILAYLKSCELPEDRETVLLEFAAYCLTTDIRLQRALMLHGKGSNGKSVFINLLKTMLGNDIVASESLQRLETDKYRIANLYGKRLNAFPDLKDTPLQTNEVFNTLVGGDRQLTGERKYEHSFNFDPTAKLMFSANKIPFAFSDNHAYYRRWILIKFPKTFEGAEIDENLLEKLTTESEMSGFINVLFEKLKPLLIRGKFSYDLGTEAVEKEYLLHSDNIAVFEDTCCRDCESGEDPTEKNLVYKLYTKWCDKNKLIPAKQKAFVKRMKTLGREVVRMTYRVGESIMHKSFHQDLVVDFEKSIIVKSVPTGLNSMPTTLSNY